MNINKHLIKTPAEIEKEEVSIVKRRYNSLAEAALNLEKANATLQSTIETMQQKLIDAQSNVDINKQIVMNSLIEQNSIKEDFILEIDVLKAKLKAYTDLSE